MLDLDARRPPSPPKDAATIVLLREGTGGEVEAFLVRRHRGSRFLGGAHVFPGGKVDDDDASPRIRARIRGWTADDAARALGEADPDPASRERALGVYVAALRETFEEAGILIADRDPPLEPAVRARLRERLVAGEATFAEVLDEANAVLRPERLRPHARWVTPGAERRRYDTRFFVARCPRSEAGSPDRRETTEAGWWTATAILAASARGEVQLAPPTSRTLELLAEAGGIDGFLGAFCPVPPPRIEPVFFDRDGVGTLAFPGDPEHPEGDAPFPGATRLELVGGRWIPAVAQSR